MKSQQLTIQKAVAAGLMMLGAFVGLYFASGRGTDAQAQVDGGALPPPSDSLPPAMDLPPPADGSLPPPGDGMLPPGGDMLPPDMAPPPGDMPMPDGNAMPPEMPPGEGLNMQMPDALMQRNVNPEGFIYNPEGLRDPFYPSRAGRPEVPLEEARPVTELDFNAQDPLQAYPLAEYKLVAVMWSVREPRAMILAGDKKVYVIKKKIRLGREGAVVVAIRESEIVVAEPNPDGTYVNANTRVIGMRK